MIHSTLSNNLMEESIQHFLCQVEVCIYSVRIVNSEPISFLFLSYYFSFFNFSLLIIFLVWT